MRSFLPTLDLDHAFESKEKMATEIKDSVAKVRIAVEDVRVFGHSSVTSSTSSVSSHPPLPSTPPLTFLFLLPCSTHAQAMDTKTEPLGTQSMSIYGIQVAKCLVVDMQPDASVLASMNQINAARRQREAAIERAEAEKIMAVRAP